MSIEDLIRESVKDAVAEAMAPVIERLDALEEMVDFIKDSTRDLPSRSDMQQAAAESIDDSLSGFQSMMRDIELNQGRAQIREARAMGRIA